MLLTNAHPLLKVSCETITSRKQPANRQNVLTKFLPGSCLILPASSSSKSAAKISEDDTSRSRRSIKVSNCVASSGFSKAYIRFSCGESCESANKDASFGCGDSTRQLASSCSLVSVGSSSQTSSHVAVSFAPCFINVLGPHELL